MLVSMTTLPTFLIIKTNSLQSGHCTNIVQVSYLINVINSLIIKPVVVLLTGSTQYDMTAKHVKC